MITTSIDPLRLREVMGRHLWFPPEPFGPDGWRMVAHGRLSSVIVTASDHPDDPREFLHASIAHTGWMPRYEELCQLHTAVWGETGWAYQCFAPPADHVNIHEHALHLWGLLSGEPLLPNFGALGSI